MQCGTACCHTGVQHDSVHHDAHGCCPPSTPQGLCRVTCCTCHRPIDKWLRFNEQLQAAGLHIRQTGSWRRRGRGEGSSSTDALLACASPHVKPGLPSTLDSNRSREGSGSSTSSMSSRASTGKHISAVGYRESCVIRIMMKSHTLCRVSYRAMSTHPGVTRLSSPLTNSHFRLTHMSIFSTRPVCCVARGRWEGCRPQRSSIRDSRADTRSNIQPVVGTASRL
jgi:hypothetical protein